MNKAVVKNVVPYSIADELGVEKGDIIEKIDGKALTDFLDFKFLTASDYYVITIIKKNGDIEEIEVYNDDFEYASIATIAGRIITDMKFDERCKKNIEQRNRQREYKKEMGKHE